ncbi:MAG: hypothetical protein U5M53_06990 [Rhodoferax sp.]|nr:hypothetical protein [Rhodoferax sp.]
MLASNKKSQKAIATTAKNAARLIKEFGSEVAKTNPTLSNLFDVAQEASFNVRLANADVVAPDANAPHVFAWIANIPKWA